MFSLIVRSNALYRQIKPICNLKAEIEVSRGRARTKKRRMMGDMLDVQYEFL